MSARQTNSSSKFRKLKKFFTDWKFGENENSDFSSNLKPTIFTVASATISPIQSNTMEKVEEKNCLYSCQNKFFGLCVIFGALPLSVEKSLDGKMCQCKYRLFSKPSIINGFVLLVFASLIWPAYETMEAYAFNNFGRVDYFFQVNSNILRTVLTMVILSSTGCRASTFAKAWNKLHALMEDMTFQNFEKLKKVGLFTFVLYSIELVVHLFFMYLNFFNVFKFELPIARIYVIQQFISLFIVDLFVGYYTLTCWIIIVGLQNITDQVESCLEDSVLRNEICSRAENENVSVRNVLADLRIKHERYCEVVRLVQKSFGIQLLAIICCTTVDFIGGVYCIIGSFEGLFPSSVSRLTFFLGVLMILYGYRVIQILFFSQLLTNTAKGPAHHLNLLKPYEGNDFGFRAEAELFLSKLANFPLEMACCDILHLSGGYLASAASHIITYVLVLMQFRLGAEQGTLNSNSTIVSN